MSQAFDRLSVLKKIESALLAGGVPVNDGIPFDDLDNEVPRLRAKGKYIKRNGLFLVWCSETDDIWVHVQTFHPQECFDDESEERYPETQTWGISVERNGKYYVLPPNNPPFEGGVFDTIIDNGNLEESISSLGRAFMSHE